MAASNRATATEAAAAASLADAARLWLEVDMVSAAADRIECADSGMLEARPPSDCTAPSACSVVYLDP